MSSFGQSGRIIEEFVLEILKGNPQLDQVRLSEYNDTGDLYYRTIHDGLTRTIQVKKMYNSDRSRPYKYAINHVKGYPNDMVIVAVNIDDKRCAIFHGSDCTLNCHSIGMTYSARAGAGKFNKFKVDWNDLQQSLSEACLLSTVVENEEDFISPTSVKEKGMTERFAKFCSQAGYVFKKDSSMGSFDGIVNGKKVQLKFASAPENRQRTYSYKITLHKHSHSVAGKYVYQPYQQGDNDYYIIELGGVYQDRFLILSEKYLIKKSFISTTYQRGKTNFNVFPPGYDKKEKSSNMGPKIKGNWTCKEDFWWNADDESRFIIF